MAKIDEEAVPYPRGAGGDVMKTLMEAEAEADINSVKPVPKRATNRQIVLGERTFTVARLGTRDGLAVARTVLRKIQVLREPIMSVMEIAGTGSAEQPETEKMIPAVMTLVEGLVDVLDEEELVGLASKLLGLDPTIIADAPLEDSLNAVADAFEMNNMGALINAARRIWESASKFVNNR